MQSKWVLSGNRVMLLLSCYISVILNMGFWNYLIQHVNLNNDVIFWLTEPILILAAMNFCMQLLF
ncbi:hypothetical protein BGI30_02200 [Snodgrassella alvi]|jgi:lipid A ethanolaminephosphotransferase|uniref:hypothetical protein n=1 Tax=Snodgrassella alvi TaxID=1196083 RepID=UPI000C1ECBB2|nr:hypothetical protein [Snodgrassella alvi]PIT12616.1 hypothetical protein BGI30_02200 [Snodgrassella alvi]PIT55945.1 hypothetical protein BHC59_09535 [Snodgrassella alvi]